MFSDQPNVVGRGLLSMVQSFLVQGCNHMYVSYILFEVPCKSNTQNADNRGFKIECTLR